MAIDLINRCRTAARAYRSNAEPRIGDTVDLSARDVLRVAELLDEAASALDRKGAFARGDRVTKTKGSSWNGHVVGFYSTAMTPMGYAVESEREPGSVQIYPESALALASNPSGVEKP